MRGSRIHHSNCTFPVYILWGKYKGRQAKMLVKSVVTPKIKNAHHQTCIYIAYKASMRTPLIWNYYFSVKFIYTPEDSSKIVLWDKGREHEEKLPKLGLNTLQYKEYLSLWANTCWFCRVHVWMSYGMLCFNNSFLVFMAEHIPQTKWQIYSKELSCSKDGRNPNTSTLHSCNHSHVLLQDGSQRAQLILKFLFTGIGYLKQVSHQHWQSHGSVGAVAR